MNIDTPLVEQWIGRDVVAGFKPEEPEQGVQYLLKRLQKGSRAGAYTLTSINAIEPPMVNATPALISAVDWHLTQSEFHDNERIVARRSHQHDMKHLVMAMREGQISRMRLNEKIYGRPRKRRKKPSQTK